jgi:hypothetical protein
MLNKVNVENLLLTYNFRFDIPREKVYFNLFNFFLPLNKLLLDIIDFNGNSHQNYFKNNFMFSYNTFSFSPIAPITLSTEAE